MDENNILYMHVCMCVCVCVCVRVRARERERERGGVIYDTHLIISLQTIQELQ